MKQDKILEITKKVTEIPLRITRWGVEQSKKLRKPSHTVTKIGTAIGGCIGGVLLLTGMVQLLTGRPLLAIGALSTGLIAIISNFFCYHRSKKQK